MTRSGEDIPERRRSRDRLPVIFRCQPKQRHGISQANIAARYVKMSGRKRMLSEKRTWLKMSPTIVTKVQILCRPQEEGCFRILKKHYNGGRASHRAEKRFKIIVSLPITYRLG